MNPSRRASLRPRLALFATTILTGVVTSAAVPAAAHASATCANSSLSQAPSAGSCFAPFSSGSTFGTQLAANAQLAPDNAAVQQHMASYGWTIGSSNNGFSIGAGDGSRLVYYASPSDPVMTIHCTSEEGPGTCQGANGITINGARINVPAGAKPDANYDAHMTVIETATGAEYDFWHTSVSGSTITSGTGAETNVNSGDGTGSGGDAANLALSAGLLRPSELVSGHIDHALVVVVPCTNATSASSGYTWPASGGWGEFCGQYWNEQASTAPELGQLMKLNMSAAQIASSGAPRWEQTIMTALTTYGAYVEDTEGSWHNEGIYILTQGSESWTNLGQGDAWANATKTFGQSGDNLNSNVPIPTSKLEMVDTCVTKGTCPNGSGTSTVRNAAARNHSITVATSRRLRRHRAARIRARLVHGSSRALPHHRRSHPRRDHAHSRRAHHRRG